ncbi:MAG: glycosyltransferase family 39 protein, partial [Candidatus Magasanikbacteria bacterium]|nr:glycosyltransferase family 39 protein [Candidatus Magasanikbacteria bacterium]
MKFLKKMKYEILVFSVFLLTRLPALGHDNFNTDVWKWKSRIYDFGTGVFGLDFIKTIQKYHPGVTLLWLGAIAVKVYNLFYDLVFKHAPIDNSIAMIFELDFVQKLFVTITIGVTLAFIFYVLNKLFGKRYAIIAVVLISLEPFYVALTRVLHLEGLMSTFMIASFVWFYYFLTDQTKKKRLYISAAFTALAVLTKTSALFMLPFLGLVLFSWDFGAKRRFWPAFRSSLNVYWKWLFFAVLVFVAVWPAMWAYPLLALQTLYRGIFTIGVEGGHDQFYFGAYTQDPGWTFYFVVLALRSSFAVLLGFVGYLFVHKKLSSDKKSFALYSLGFTILYLAFLTFPSKKLDRYIIPAILSFILVVSFYYERLKNYILVLLVIPAIFILVRIHPDYFSYYNPLFGGLRTGINVIEPKWLIGESEIAFYLRNVMVKDNLTKIVPGESFESMVDTPQ